MGNLGLEVVEEYHVPFPLLCINSSEEIDKHGINFQYPQNDIFSFSIVSAYFYFIRPSKACLLPCSAFIQAELEKITIIHAQNKNNVAHKQIWLTYAKENEVHAFNNEKIYISDKFVYKLEINKIIRFVRAFFFSSMSYGKHSFFPFHRPMNINISYFGYRTHFISGIA